MGLLDGLLQSQWQDLYFDGLEIDMNDPSNYCTGDVCFNDGEHQVQCSLLQSSPQILIDPSLSLVIVWRWGKIRPSADVRS